MPYPGGGRRPARANACAGGAQRSERRTGHGVEGLPEDLGALRAEGQGERQDGDERIEAEHADEEQRPHQLVDRADGHQCAAQEKPPRTHRPPRRTIPCRVAENQAADQAHHQRTRRSEQGQGQRRRRRLQDHLEEAGFQRGVQHGRRKIVEQGQAAVVDRIAARGTARCTAQASSPATAVTAASLRSSVLRPLTDFRPSADAAGGASSRVVMRARRGRPGPRHRRRRPGGRGRSALGADRPRACSVRGRMPAGAG